jgi:hypothetical protein
VTVNLQRLIDGKLLAHTWVFCTKGIPANFFDIAPLFPKDIVAKPGKQTLRSILESQNIIQLWFDVRSDVDALFGLCRVHLGRIVDIQLMELATRYYGRERVASLSNCMGNIGGNFLKTPYYKLG